MKITDLNQHKLTVLQFCRSDAHSAETKVPEKLYTFLVADIVKSPPTMQETWVRFLGQEDPLEEGMATHSSILTWKTTWTGEPGGLQSMGSQRVRHN